MKNLDKINVGASPNTGDGDTLRDAFIKVNDNFDNVTDNINEVVGNVYDKAEVDAKLATKANKSEIPTKLSELDNDMNFGKVKSVNGRSPDAQGNVNIPSGGGCGGGIPDAPLDGVAYARKDEDWTPTYTKTEADTTFETKDASNTKLNTKADKSDTYTKGEVDGLIPDVSEFGKVKSVNNTQPDSDGNVTLTIPQPTVPTLDEVLDAGNSSVSKSIILGDNREDFKRYTRYTKGGMAKVDTYNITSMLDSNEKLYQRIYDSQDMYKIEAPTSIAGSGFLTVKFPLKSGTVAMTSDITSGVPEAPIGGRTYGRNNNQWVQVPEEAPNDGKEYVRKSLGWVEVTSGGGGSSLPLTFDTTKNAYYDSDIALTEVGSNSIAIGGSGTIAKGPTSVAVGWNAKSAGNNSTALGNANASGSNTTSLGYLSEATATQAVAVGSSTKASSNYSVVIGYQSKSGMGTSQHSCVAIGRAAQARNLETIAIGSKADAPNSGGIAIGKDTRGDSHGVAVGTGAKSSTTAAIAIGHNTSSYSKYATSIGAGNNTNRFGCTTVGAFGETLADETPDYKRVWNGPAFIVGAGNSDTDRKDAMRVLSSGDIELPLDNSGIILKSPDGTRYKLIVEDGGTLNVSPM